MASKSATPTLDEALTIAGGHYYAEGNNGKTILECNTCGKWHVFADEDAAAHWIVTDGLCACDLAEGTPPREHPEGEVW